MRPIYCVFTHLDIKWTHDDSYERQLERVSPNLWLCLRCLSHSDILHIHEQPRPEAMLMLMQNHRTHLSSNLKRRSENLE
jgi:hypothetical protein